jgi:hypothetical protein
MGQGVGAYGSGSKGESSTTDPPETEWPAWDVPSIALFRAMLGGAKMNDEEPTRRWREGPREIQEMLVEWEHLSPVCSRLKLREWG